MSDNSNNGNGQTGRRNGPGQGRLPPATTGWRGAVNSFLDGLFGRLPADDRWDQDNGQDNGQGRHNGGNDSPTNQPMARE